MFVCTQSCHLPFLITPASVNQGKARGGVSQPRWLLQVASFSTPICKASAAEIADCPEVTQLGASCGFPCRAGACGGGFCEAMPRLGLQ